MTVQMLKIAGREFVLVAKRDFQRMAEKARRQIEDEYWTETALKAEAKSRARGEAPIAFEQIERELDEMTPRRRARRGRK